MRLMEEMIRQALPIWDACLEARFVQELKTGKLPEEKFRQYMIQDSIYLKHYARVYGRAIHCADTLRDIQMYYAGLGFVTEAESAVRLRYLEAFGLTDSDIERCVPLPENRRYIDYMLDIAARGRPREILMVILPCMLSYAYIGAQLASDPAARSSRYCDFIRDYADEAYQAECRRWLDFAEALCAPLEAGEAERLRDVFIQASRLELDFWNMAYGSVEI
jgi:thiaminase/transcriptional activator TenA